MHDRREAREETETWGEKGKEGIKALAPTRCQNVNAQDETSNRTAVWREHKSSKAYLYR
ncbi:predicted protein [Sclerotinia sclerotiorum 1980 UF-70]|uniref:Uncharacterized protein n=1 Tax=Sclerotinia sclerotiorum (strain ATCC 18683 / 1980 / Ss-1) TaxID=665079 RepID=A7F4W9_SCLS1|nr:predicted protein [Sclerotinia sclerotiorum 1980 UF-70]EDN97790.1 predicted protein [Sclerotinia sclerotiorum 1980 UF-70]